MRRDLIPIRILALVGGMAVTAAIVDAAVCEAYSPKFNHNYAEDKLIGRLQERAELGAINALGYFGMPILLLAYFGPLALDRTAADHRKGRLTIPKRNVGQDAATNTTTDFTGTSVADGSR